METKIFTLQNGMRAVCRQTDGLVSYIGVVVDAGSRDDFSGLQGTAHFVEHTVFKGTVTRKAWKIASCMETIGGELNAYTSKEETVIYTNAPAGYEERALGLLSDLIESSVFPEEEVDKEKDVVVEEINSYLDSPADSVYDDFEELAYAGSALAHNILGTPESVKGINSSDCRRFLETRYLPGRMVLYMQTPRSMSWMERNASAYFGRIARNGTTPVRLSPVPTGSFSERRDRGSHQANTVTGTRVFDRVDSRRFSLFLLNNYLGGPGMNSRLNRELRDKRGYVYTVESNVALLSDTGLFSVYFGSDPSTVGRCLKLIDREIDRLADKSLPSVTFERIKRQYCGQLTVSSDHRESRAMSMGKSVLYFGDVHDISETAEHIRAVTPEEMRQTAELLANSPRGTLTLT